MQEKISFDDWMRDTVQSIYYSDNNSMLSAYERVGMQNDDSVKFLYVK